MKTYSLENGKMVEQPGKTGEWVKRSEVEEMLKSIRKDLLEKNDASIKAVFSRAEAERVGRNRECNDHQGRHL